MLPCFLAKGVRVLRRASQVEFSRRNSRKEGVPGRTEGRRWKGPESGRHAGGIGSQVPRGSRGRDGEKSRGSKRKGEERGPRSRVHRDRSGTTRATRSKETRGGGPHPSRPETRGPPSDPPFPTWTLPTDPLLLSSCLWLVVSPLFSSGASSPDAGSGRSSGGTIGSRGDRGRTE